MSNLIHNFCWAIVNPKKFHATGEAVFVPKDNLKDYTKNNFEVRIPYFISKNINSDDREKMEKSILSEGFEAFDFMALLKHDMKHGKNKSIAKKTYSLIKAFDGSDNEPSDKIATIVDLMKLYMVTKVNNCSIDFNMKLENSDAYRKLLSEEEVLSASSRPNLPMPENKYTYIANASEHKVSFSSKIIDKLHDKYCEHSSLNQEESSFLFRCLSSSEKPNIELERNSVYGYYSPLMSKIEGTLLPHSIVSGQSGGKSYEDSNNGKAYGV